MLSHAIWGLFWSILIQNRLKKHIVDQNLDGARACCAPFRALLYPPLEWVCICSRWIVSIWTLEPHFIRKCLPQMFGSIVFMGQQWVDQDEWVYICSRWIVFIWTFEPPFHNDTLSSGTSPSPSKLEILPPNVWIVHMGQQWVEQDEWVYICSRWIVFIWTFEPHFIVILYPVSLLHHPQNWKCFPQMFGLFVRGSSE